MFRRYKRPRHIKWMSNTVAAMQGSLWFFKFMEVVYGVFLLPFELSWIVVFAPSWVFIPALLAYSIAYELEQQQADQIEDSFQ